MVAEMVHEAAPLPLLFPPDMPSTKADRLPAGWRWGSRPFRGGHELEIVRDNRADGYGAQVQEAIARYVIHGAHRADCAAMLGITARQFQAYMAGESWATYARPVLGALRRLGIQTTRGERVDGGTRQREIIAASQSVMRRAIDALEGPDIGPDAREKLLADLYLLTVAGEAER